MGQWGTGAGKDGAIRISLKESGWAVTGRSRSWGSSEEGPEQASGDPEGRRWVRRFGVNRITREAWVTQRE